MLAHPDDARNDPTEDRLMTAEERTATEDRVAKWVDEASDYERHTMYRQLHRAHGITMDDIDFKIRHLGKLELAPDAPVEGLGMSQYNSVIGWH